MTGTVQSGDETNGRKSSSTVSELCSIFDRAQRCDDIDSFPEWNPPKVYSNIRTDLHQNVEPSINQILRVRPHNFAASDWSKFAMIDPDLAEGRMDGYYIQFRATFWERYARRFLITLGEEATLSMTRKIMWEYVVPGPNLWCDVLIGAAIRIFENIAMVVGLPVFVIAQIHGHSSGARSIVNTFHLKVFWNDTSTIRANAQMQVCSKCSR
jgi:hypothetical protein